MASELLSDEHVASFFDNAWITDVLYPVKSGKEATVYCCRAHPRTGQRLLALKVYRELRSRGFRNDAAYTEGRFRQETHELRAMRKKTAKGREFQFGAWLGHEYETIRTLHTAGAAVPRPIAAGENALLMEFIGDGDGAAPTLQTIDLRRVEAERLFSEALRNVELMLGCNLVHGDLSAYNLLYWQGRLRLIDFPQAIDPRFNSNAYSFLQRDIENLCRYFQRQGIAAEPARIAGRLWDRFVRSDL
ncbi:MAG TPA: RIO1 family regulatory kinase/ATPase [Dehalococcoidia bacterium]|nr:RIO1 family regulatory kinase/ATPase [Dehalococcoidia bacterium]